MKRPAPGTGLGEGCQWSAGREWRAGGRECSAVPVPESSTPPSNRLVTQPPIGQEFSNATRNWSSHTPYGTGNTEGPEFLWSQSHSRVTR